MVIVPALGTPALQWVGVQRALQDHTTVCLVDRAGLGWSDPGPWPRSFGRMADELATVLEAARIPPPYVLVGHSTGGLITRLYSARHPQRVAAKYVRMMDMLSRCVQALEQGDWSYLADKAGDVRTAVGELEAAAVRGDQAQPPPRAAAVLAAVTSRGWHYRAIERLHAGPTDR